MSREVFATGRANTGTVVISKSTVNTIWQAHQPQPHRGETFSGAACRELDEAL